MTDDNTVRTTGPEMAAVRKILARMAGYGEDDDAPLNDLTLATEAAERFGDLCDRVAELEQVVDTDLDAIAYEQMSKKDKAREIRAYLYREAEQSTTGKASMEYREVKTLFNGRPSPGHAYDLMRAAATADGFDYDERDNATNRLRVNTDGVNAEAVFHAANNATESNPA